MMRTELKNARITILVNDDRTTIEVYDETSCIAFLKVTLDPQQLSSALSRLHRTNCQKVEVYDLEKVGKVREMVDLRFELPDPSITYREKQNEHLLNSLALSAAKAQLGEDWTPNYYFGSQNSFFSDDKGRKFARCHAVRWVEPKEEQQ